MLANLSLLVVAQCCGAADYAELRYRDAWTRHSICGEASFDAFVRSEINPVHRGSPPYEWPVNGFLFADPVGGDWYLYVGHYLRGYRVDPALRSRCTVFRSADAGRSWEHLGPVFDDTPHLFEGETSPMASAPDVSVVYRDGRYHMCFDWGTANFKWEHAADPPPDANSGVGYAWAERPEGPFRIGAKPIATTREQEPLEGKYRRLYASTIVPRARDWLVLTLTDSGPNFGWALLGMTAEHPEGPYSPPVLLLHPESDRFLPPLLEYFPAFTHEGHVYAPATSVAANRNFQALFRAPLERAADPGAWELAQLGSFWHAEPVEHEAHGIWGQTVSGFVNDEGIFSVMFPSRDTQGLGTINLASRRWDTPFRARGFVVSGHEGPSVVYLRRGGARRIEADLEIRGTIAVLWDTPGLLGPNRPTADSVPHPRTLSRCSGLELTPGEWAVFTTDARADRRDHARGPLEERLRRHVVVEREDTGAGVVRVDGAEVWRGEIPAATGVPGLYAGPRSHAFVERFVVESASEAGLVTHLHTDALVGAAQNMATWEERGDEHFRLGMGAVSAGPEGRGKWNIEGGAFALWAPRSPDFGSADLLVDGVHVATLDFHAPAAEPSRPLYESGPLAPGPRAVILRGRSGRFPLDTLDVRAENPAPESREP